MVDLGTLRVTCCCKVLYNLVALQQQLLLITESSEYLNTILLLC